MIISTYNREKLLCRAIESVLSQDFLDFELLIIDNGSTDSTRSVIEKFQDGRVKYMRNPLPTSSCDGPRNMGIYAAKGTLISFLDDDDRWYPQKLKKVNEAFDAHPDIQAVGHYENRITYGKSSGCIEHGSASTNLFESLLYEKNCLSPCAITIKTEVLRKLNGFDLRREFSAAADYDMWLRMAKMDIKFYFIKEALGEFYFTGNNGCVADPEFDARVAYIIKYHILQYEGKKFLKISKRGARRLILMHITAMRSLFLGKRFGKAGKYLSETALLLLLHPYLIFSLTCDKIITMHRKRSS